jgi:hypothetical protein
VENDKPMAGSRGDTVPGRIHADVIGALGLVALGVGALVLQRSRSGGGQRLPDDRRRDLVAYLHDHLSGADAAIQVVDSLMRRGAGEGTLFASLHEQFGEDRSAVVALLASLGASSRSVKRVAGRTAGGVLRMVAVGRPGELALFRTLEGLAVGVQGKRCLWRAAQAFAPSLQPGGRSFVELESRALDQWEQIERWRQALARQTFGVL